MIEEVTEVHLWWDHHSDGGPEWVISTVDKDGDEIQCLGGCGQDVQDAWDEATGKAEDFAVPAILLDRWTGVTVDRWEPSDPTEGSKP